MTKPWLEKVGAFFKQKGCDSFDTPPSPVYAQQVQQKGNNFTQVAKTTKGKEIKTIYTFTDSKGKTSPVWLSSTGKAFVKKVSKKSGKEYKLYLSEIGKKINPKAYKYK